MISAILVCLFTSCSTSWEYKVVTVDGENGKGFEPKSIKITGNDLNIFGKDGWELVGVYTNTETVYPNFGNADYVTGIRENVRTSSVNLIFKRKK